MTNFADVAVGVSSSFSVSLQAENNLVQKHCHFTDVNMRNIAEGWVRIIFLQSPASFFLCVCGRCYCYSVLDQMPMAQATVCFWIRAVHSSQWGEKAGNPEQFSLRRFIKLRTMCNVFRGRASNQNVLITF